MAHQEQHDGGTDSRLGTALSTFTMLRDTMQKPFLCKQILSEDSTQLKLARLATRTAIARTP